ncbi:MAG: AtpZ/AtpI family protein [Peptostreptococcaceae bacterium]
MSKKNMYMEIANTLSLLSQLGLIMLIPILGLSFLGKYIDTKLDTEPIFFLIFLLLGVGGGFMGVYKTLKVFIKRK